jgi:DNA-binding MarR family transcriptional regulator
MASPASPTFPEHDGGFGFLLQDVARLLRAHFNRRVQVLGLTQAQCRVVLRLAHHEGIQQVALAEILEIQPITLARLLDKLQAAGWVERRRDPNDRRAFCLYLTAQAYAQLKPIWALGSETRAAAIAGLDDAQLTGLTSTLQAMKDNLLREVTTPTPTATRKDTDA